MPMTSSINRLKERAQKPFSVEILREHQDYYFFEVGYAFACNYWGAYFFRFSRKLSDGQKIAHMIKSADSACPWKSQHPKMKNLLFFALNILNSITQTRICSFFPISSHMTPKSSRKLIFLYRLCRLWSHYC